MFLQKNVYLLAAMAMIGWTVYMMMNKEHFIREHLSNPTPTLVTLQKEIDETNKKLQDLNDDYQDLKKRGQAQGSQAAAAIASLQAIPAASPNTVLPTR